MCGEISTLHINTEKEIGQIIYSSRFRTDIRTWVEYISDSVLFYMQE